MTRDTKEPGDRLPHKEFLNPLRKALGLRSDKERKHNGERAAYGRRKSAMKVTLAPLRRNT